SDGSFDGDLRHLGEGIFDTSDAARAATAPRPTSDDRGIISYPGYQIAVARGGDTVETVAARIGMPAAELAGYNAPSAGTPLRRGEVLALPRRVAEPTGALGTGGAGGSIDVTTLASGAIARAQSGGTGTAQPAPGGSPFTSEPIRHRVGRGET